MWRPQMMGGYIVVEQSHGRLVFFFVAKKKARQLEGKAGTNRWPGSSTADNEPACSLCHLSEAQPQAGTGQSMQ